MEKKSKIYVAGHRGLMGSGILRALEKSGYKNIIVKTRQELDLLDQKAVSDFFNSEKPEYVFVGAAKVGGIMDNNNNPAKFIYENLVIETNIIHSAYKSGVKKLLFPGSSCIYPKFAEQPIKEEYLMTGLLEPTSMPYAVAKIAGIVMCQSYAKQYGCNFISVMPSNLYGINDNFDPETSHALPGLIRKFHDATVNGNKTVTLWGTGKARREFLCSDDLADACMFLMENYDKPEMLNIGSGDDITIKDLSEIIVKITGFKGTIIWDDSKPEGVARKLTDNSKIRALGWKPKISLEEGIKLTYEWYKNSLKGAVETDEK